MQQTEMLISEILSARLSRMPVPWKTMLPIVM